MNSENPQMNGNKTPPTCNMQEFDNLRQECVKLRQALAEAEAERDKFRSMVYAQVRSQLTEKDKEKLEARARDAIENRGVPFRKAIAQLKQ